MGTLFRVEVRSSQGVLARVVDLEAAGQREAVLEAALCVVPRWHEGVFVSVTCVRRRWRRVPARWVVVWRARGVALVWMFARCRVVRGG